MQNPDSKTYWKRSCEKRKGNGDILQESLGSNNHLLSFHRNLSMRYDK
jgi:hypothetical protein